MKRIISAAVISIVFFAALFLNAQAVKPKPIGSRLTLLSKPYVKVLVMNKWENGMVNNQAIVSLKERNASGTPITGAAVTVNGRSLSFNNSIREYMGNIGNITPGQKVPFSIKTKDKRQLSGYVVASYFVTIVKPAPNTLFAANKPIKVDWKFNPGATYLVVFKLLIGNTQKFSTDVNGNSYTINLMAPAMGSLSRLIPAEINAMVISPWTEKYKITGTYAPGSKGQFYTSATVTIRLKK